MPAGMCMKILWHEEKREISYLEETNFLYVEDVNYPPKLKGIIQKEDLASVEFIKFAVSFFLNT